jgi:hypothetical protein
MKEIRIFICYASDSEEECEAIKDIICDESNNHFEEKGYKFTPICWKDAIPGLGSPQEDKIDPLIVDSDCRLIILVLKNILGTRYKYNQTGIEHEYSLAKKLNKDIMILRCDFRMRPSEIDPEQLKNVNEFILKAKNEGLIEDRISSNDDFKKTFRTKFALWAKRLINMSQNLSDKFKMQNRGF